MEANGDMCMSQCMSECVSECMSQWLCYGNISWIVWYWGCFTSCLLMAIFGFLILTLPSSNQPHPQWSGESDNAATDVCSRLCQLHIAQRPPVCHVPRCLWTQWNQQVTGGQSPHPFYTYAIGNNFHKMLTLDFVGIPCRCLEDSHKCHF